MANGRSGCLTAIIILLVLVALVLALGGIAFYWYKTGVDTVVALDEKVQSAWGQVEAVLQRRYDLIPNLVATVKGYASHEKELLTQITELRSQWGAAQTREQKIGTAGQLDSLLSRLMVVLENYPDLKASQSFQMLQAQLEGSENRISVERQRYNDAVRQFNSYIRSYFGRFFAKRRGLEKPAEYYGAAPEAAAAPKVQF